MDSIIENLYQAGSSGFNGFLFSLFPDERGKVVSASQKKPFFFIAAGDEYFVVSFKTTKTSCRSH
jgi:hypothetical protein